jgi:hypothetical protein
MPDAAPVASLDLVAQLRDLGVARDDVSLVLPPGLPWGQFEAIGAMLGVAHRGIQWMIGDWMLYGEGEYGEIVYQAAAATGMAEQTCMNYMSVAKAIPPSRRRPNVPFSVHDAVRTLPPKEQKQVLDRAARGMPRREVRELVRELKGDPAPVVAVCECCGRPK